MATKIKHLKVGGTTYDIAATTADSMGEANLTWGGKNFVNSVGPVDAALNPCLGANRLAGMHPAGITVEYSTNGGSSWSTYPLTDAQKTALVTTSTTLRIGGPTASQTANSQVRVTLDGVSGGVYTQLNKLHIYVSADYSNGTTVTMESYDYNNSTSWHSILTSRIDGWSGWNVLNFTLPGAYPFGGDNDNHQRKIRLTFKQTGITSGHESAGLHIFQIYGYGGVGWGAPSNLAKYGTLYTYDEYLNVTFPKQVTATQFNGNATGLVDAGNGNTITANYSAAAMDYDHFQYLTVWNGYCLKSVEKTDFVRNNDSGVSTALNKLSVGSSDPKDADYYICQYAGGGTTTTSYHRRPMSALWNYIDRKVGKKYIPLNGISDSDSGATTQFSAFGMDCQYSGQHAYYGAQEAQIPNSAGSNAIVIRGDSIICKNLSTGNYDWQLTSISDSKGTSSSVVMSQKGVANNYAALSGATFTGAVTINAGVNLKFNKIQAPTTSGGSTYGNGSSGQVLKSNGSTVYWAADNNSDSDNKTSSANTTSKIYLVGPTSQSSSGQTTYSNSSCYASGGYLYSNGVKVDMSSVGVEWSTF